MESAGSQGCEGLVLTEAQAVALETAKTEKQASGEFESECKRYCGPFAVPSARLRLAQPLASFAQGTCHSGQDERRGRIRQQTFIGTYSKAAFAKLYDHKTDHGGRSRK